MVSWQVFQKEVEDNLFQHECGFTPSAPALRTIGLLGLLHNVGCVSEDYLNTHIAGKPINRLRRLQIVGKLYYYIIHYYSTLKEYGRSKRPTIYNHDNIEILSLIWKMEVCILSIQDKTNVCMSEEDTGNVIITLKHLEALIHTLAAAYHLSFVEIRQTLFFDLDDKFIPDIQINIQELIDANLYVDEYFVLVGLYKYTIEEAGELFLPKLKDIKRFLPELHVRQERLTKIISKLQRFRFLGTKKKRYYITDKAKKFMRMQKSI